MTDSNKFLAVLLMLFTLAVVYRVAPGTTIVLAITILVVAYLAHGREGRR